MTRHLKFFALATTALALLALAPIASAFTTRAPIGSFGVDGTSATKFSAPATLGFNQTRDRLYVDDAGPDSIYCFGMPAQTPCGGAFPLVVSAADSSGPLAVDNTAGAGAGNLFYSDLRASGQSRLFGFDSAGAPLGGNFPAIVPGGGNNIGGIALDSAANIWVSVTSRGTKIGVFRFNSVGSAPTMVVLPADLPGNPAPLVFDSADNLYVGFGGPSGPDVRRYTAASNYTASTQLPGTAGGTVAIAVDRTTDRVYVGGNNDVKVFDSSGTLLYQLGQIPSKGFNAPAIRGIAIDESTDRVYVSDTNSANDRVWIFGPPADYPNATITQSAAANVTEITADLSGILDDNSVLATTWRFEVSKDGGATWTNQGSSTTTAGNQSGLAIFVRATNLDQDTDYLGRIKTNKGPGSTDVFSNEVSFRTVAIPPATATIDPADNVTDSRADLRATITDNGTFPTNWRFEISADNGATWVVARNNGNPISGSTAGNQSDVVVSGVATGLVPDSDYLLRIVTDKGHGAPDIPVETDPFRTLAVPPVLSKIGAFRVLDTSAYLVASIDPRNAETTYYFEYGDQGPCDTNPCGRTDEVQIPDNIARDVVVHPQVTGLEPDTTYHFSLTASNAAGSITSADFTLHTLPELPAQPDCDNEEIREAQGSTYLPECRAWEQATPPDKNFDTSGGSGGSVSVDGQAVSTQTVASFGDPPGPVGAAEGSGYISRRGPDGWRTMAMVPPFCHGGFTVFAFAQGTPSSNLDYAFISRPEIANCPLEKLDPAAPNSQSNVYRVNLTADPTTYDLLVPEPLGTIVGASDDSGRVVLSSRNAQGIADVPAGNLRKLFEWHDGSIELLSRGVDGVPLATEVVLAPDGGTREYANPVSAKGDRVFFNNPEPESGSGMSCASLAACDLYMREDAAETHLISESECSSSCGVPAGVLFRRATPDGSRVIFTSAERLTEDPTPAGSNLYLYTHSDDPASEENLTLLSPDAEVGDGAGILGTLGISDGGDVVYFVADGQLVSGASTASGPKLYRWSFNSGSPTLEYLATLVSSANGSDDLSNWDTTGGRQNVRHISPDGRYLLIHTPAQLDGIADQDTDADVYLWREQGGWACLSCQLPGLTSAGKSILGQSAHSSEASISLADDGRAVFFESRDSLVSEDTNGGAKDIYEWHDGMLSLISSGKDPSDVRLIGADGTGQSVFFHTEAQLTGSDVDEVYDIYVARVGGGIASQNQASPAPPCEGEACRGAGSSAGSPTGAGTGVFTGPPDPDVRWPPRKSTCPRGKRKVTRKGRTRCVKPRNKRRGAKKRRAAAHGRTAR